MKDVEGSLDDVQDDLEGMRVKTEVLRAKDPKVRRARVCITAAGLVLQGIAGSKCWPLDALV